MSFDNLKTNYSTSFIVSIPLEQGNVFRQLLGDSYAELAKSQSLWNRAMSFDPKITVKNPGKYVSIPLEQGNVFRHLI